MGAYNEEWFWGIKTTSFDTAYALTQGMMMDQAHKRCEKGLHQLTKDLSGRQGPMKSWFYYQAMCTSFCLDSDAFHQAALSESGCLCTELAVTDDDEADDDQVRHRMPRCRGILPPAGACCAVQLPLWLLSVRSRPAPKPAPTRAS